MRIQNPLLLCLTLALVACQQPAAQQKETRYAQVAFRESPYAEYKGIIPMDEATASDKLHYEFSYDSQGRPIEIQYKRGDQPFSGQEILDRFFFPSSKITFDYSANSIVLRFFDHNNQRMNAYGSVYEAVYSLNEQGEKTALDYYNREGEKTQTADSVAHYEWSKSRDGLIIEKRMNLEGELQPLRPNFPFFETHMKYDDRGMISEMLNYGKSGVLENNETGAAIDVIKYDEVGNFVEWRVLDKDRKPVAGNGPRVARGASKQDEFGNDVLLEFFDVDGSRMANYQGNAIVKIKYNSQLHLVEQAVFTADEQPVTDGIAIFTTDYDERGNRIRISGLDANRKPIATAQFFGAAMQENKYDEFNNQIEARYLDADGNLVPLQQLGGGSVIQYIFDGLQRTAVVILDKDGKEIRRIER